MPVHLEWLVMLRFQYMQDASINTGLGSLYANKSTLCTRVLILILSLLETTALCVLHHSREHLQPCPSLSRYPDDRVEFRKTRKPQEHKSPLSSHCAPGNMNTNARNSFPSLPCTPASNHLPPCERLQTSKGPPFTRDHSGVTKTHLGKNATVAKHWLIRLNCFSGIAVKNRAYSLNKTLQNNKATHNNKTLQQANKKNPMKQTNKQKKQTKTPKHKQKQNQNQIKQTIPGKQEEVMLESPPAALHVQSPALPSLEQCLHPTYTSSPQVFTQKHLQTSCTKSWLVFVLFFSFCKTALVFPGQTAAQVSSAALGASDTSSARGTGTSAATLLWDLLQKLWGHQGVLGRQCQH